MPMLNLHNGEHTVTIHGSYGEFPMAYLLGTNSASSLALREALSRASLVIRSASAGAALFPRSQPTHPFTLGWHVRVIAAKLAAVHQGKIRRLIVNLPPRHLKSHLASVAFPAWCLGHRPSAQILCVTPGF